jgi:hypothetical protein
MPYEAKVTKLKEQVCESMASSLGGSPPPTLVMLRVRPILKYQLEHHQLLDQHGRPVGAPEVKKHTTYVQYTLEGLRELAKLSWQKPGELLWHGCCTYGMMELIL